MQEEYLIHPIKNMIRQRTGTLPPLACLPCEEVGIYICSNLAQVPLLKSTDDVFCLVIPLTHKMHLPGNTRAQACCHGEVLALSEYHFPDFLSIRMSDGSCGSERLLLLFYKQTMLTSALRQTGVMADTAVSCKQIQQLNLPGLQRVHEILCVYVEACPGRKAILSCNAYALLLQVLCHTGRQWSVKSLQLQTCADKTLAEICRFMQANFTCKLTVGELARRADRSVSHFIRTFKRQYGISPHQMLILLRIQQARQFICNSDLSIGEICSHCGFRSHSNFSSYFSRETGMSPQQYRKHFR